MSLWYLDLGSRGLLRVSFIFITPLYLAQYHSRPSKVMEIIHAIPILIKSSSPSNVGPTASFRSIPFKRESMSGEATNCLFTSPRTVRCLFSMSRWTTCWRNEGWVAALTYEDAKWGKKMK